MQAQNISFRYDGCVDFVLKDASFSIESGEHVALVGPNGSGKSTLLKILVGELKVQKGLVNQEGQEVLYLPQEIDFSSSLSVRDWLFEKLGLAEIDEKLESLIKAGLENGERLKKWGEIRQRYEHLDGDNFDTNLEKAMHQVPLIDFSIKQGVNSLSGGQIQRLKLLLIALAKHDIVLMDEPTNDLDYNGIVWLENWILKTKSGVVIVSHDRQLLNKVVNHIAAIDRETHKTLKAKSSYGDFLEQLEAMRMKLMIDHERQDKQIKDLKKRIAEAKSKANRGLGKAGAADGDKLARNYRAERGAGRAAAKVRRLKQQLTAIVRIELAKHYEMRFDYDIVPIQSPVAVSFEKVTAQLGDKKFGPYSGNILTKDRLLISGPNGSGKTTFLRMLFGDLKRKGRVKIAKDAKVFFMPQNRWLDPEENVWNFISQQVKLAEGEVKSRLVQYGVTENLWSNSLAKLSPGERTRLLVCLINLKRPNLLVLDEPTNHMDVEAIEAIEKGLINFIGTLVVVSHDQIFLKNINVNKVWEISGNKIKT